MKKALSILFASACASAALSATVTDADINRSFDAIKKANSPRYSQFNHAKIVEGMEAFAKTNDLSYAQTIFVARRIAEHAAAIKDGSAVFDKYFAVIDGCTNAQLKASNLQSYIQAATHTYSFNREAGWKTAMKIFDKDASLFDWRYRIQRRADFATLGVLLYRDRAAARYDDLFNAVIAETCPGGNQQTTNTFNDIKGAATVTLCSALLPLGENVANEQFKKFGTSLAPKHRNAFKTNLAKSYVDHNDRPGFDSVLREIGALPLQERIEPYCAILSALAKFDHDLAVRLADDELADKNLTPAQRQRYLALKQGFFDPPLFNYGFNSPECYKKWREVIRERIALEDANKDDAGAKFFTDARGKSWEIERMVWYDDLATAELLLSRSLALWPNDLTLNAWQARILALRGDTKAAAAKLRENLSLKGVKDADTNSTLRVVAFLEGGGIKGFDKVNAMLNLTPQQRLEALRQTSRTLFNYRRYDDCRTISGEITGNMYTPDLIRVHTATYMPNAPKTADGFVRTEMYDDWSKMETRFYPYGDCYGENPDVDASRHLKGVEQPKCDEAYPTGIRVVYDDEGVHVFIRGDDPAIDEVNLGKRNAGGLEICFRPGGDDKPYRSIFLEGLPDVGDPHMAEWASPTRGYKRNTEAVVKDAALTEKGFVAHVYFPWLAFYNDLPLDGASWRFGVLRSTPKGLYTVGGIVHELSRSMEIKFDFTKQQMRSLRRRVSIQAYNQYKAIRNNDAKFIKMWDDELLGDKKFFAAEVAPLLEKLDKAGEELLASAPDSDAGKYFDEYLPLWAGIDYEIADIRTRYLNKQLFEEE